MHMENDQQGLLDRPADRVLLHHWAHKTKAGENSLREAFLESGIYPGKDRWLTWSVRFFAGTGVAFLLAGILFFFAWNWADMSRMLKFGVIAGAMLLITAVSLLLKKKHEFAFQLGLTIVSGLTGVLFAVHGQEYQTGANSFELFRNWALAILVLVAISRFPPLWLLYTVLLNIVAVTWSSQYDDDYLFTGLFAANALAFFAWEICRLAGADFIRPKWFPRVTGLAALTAISLKVLGSSFGQSTDAMICHLLLIPFIGVLGLWFGFFRKDLFFLSSAVFFSILLLSKYFNLLLPESGENDLSRTINRIYYLMLLRGSFIILATSLAGIRLVKLNKKWKSHESL